jgi:glycine cleavage system regulatory protein
MASLILTVVGPDRPGLVSRLSEQVAARGGSWLESRMARLAGQFAGIVLIDIGDDEVEPLDRSFDPLRADGLQVLIHPAAAGATPLPAPDTLLVLDLVCQDRPGLIREITRVLAASGVNIEELTTNILSGSFSGETLFRAEARLLVPAAIGPDRLRRELERLGNDLMVDFNLTEPPPG